MIHTEPAPPSVNRGAWHYADGRPDLPGIRITTGASVLFVPNTHIYQLAVDLTNYLEENR